MKRRAGPIVLFGLVATLVAGCSSSTDGSATPTSSSTTTDDPTSASTSPISAPLVGKPLDATKILATPCSALTAADLPGLKLTGASNESHTTADAPVCNWDTEDATHGIGIAWLVPNTTGLSSLYDQRIDQQYWQPLFVDGYPAVFADIADLRTRGDCRINVGVNNSLYFFADYQVVGDSGDKADVCELAEAAASDVIKNLQGGQ